MCSSRWGPVNKPMSPEVRFSRLDFLISIFSIDRPNTLPNRLPSPANQVHWHVLRNERMKRNRKSFYTGRLGCRHSLPLLQGVAANWMLPQFLLLIEGTGARLGHGSRGLCRCSLQGMQALCAAAGRGDGRGGEERSFPSNGCRLRPSAPPGPRIGPVVHPSVGDFFRPRSWSLA